MANEYSATQRTGVVGAERTTNHQWTFDSDGDGQSVEIAAYADRTVGVAFDAGSGTITIEGSFDGSTWFTLTDAQGNALTFTADGIQLIAENPKLVRPSLGGSSTPDITVWITGRKC